LKKIGIILGSGFNDFRKEIQNPVVIHRESGGVHKKNVIEGQISGRNVVIFTGRNHFYESDSPEKVLQNVEIAKSSGVEFLIITNAAGGLNKQFKVTDFMLINSYISFIKKPVIRKSFTLNNELVNWAYECSVRESLPVHKGNYFATIGPAYETKSEIRFLKKIKVDAAGMSTIPEILKASEYGIETLAISCITNMLSESNPHIVTHDEVISAGKKSYNNFSKLLKALINDY
jgi:purine-nucleoside phosphorylase